jgi:hypothetical protein
VDYLALEDRELPPTLTRMPRQGFPGLSSNWPYMVMPHDISIVQYFRYPADLLLKEMCLGRFFTVEAEYDYLVIGTSIANHHG